MNQVLAFEQNDDDADEQRISKTRYYLPTVEIKVYNVIIDEKNVFDQPDKK